MNEKFCISLLWIPLTKQVSYWGKWEKAWVPSNPFPQFLSTENLENFCLVSPFRMHGMNSKPFLVMFLCKWKINHVPISNFEWCCDPYLTPITPITPQLFSPHNTYCLIYNFSLFSPFVIFFSESVSPWEQGAHFFTDTPSMEPET